MEFGSLKIDFTGLAALLAAMVAAYSTFKGRAQMRAKKQEVDNAKSE